MKRLFNITTCDYDLARYAGADDLTRVLREYALDGLEVLPIGENSLGWIPPRMVPGIHLTYFNSWLDAYRGDAARVEAEYGSMEEAERQLGGPADGLARRLRAQLDWCQSIGAQYVVYHVGNITLSETASCRFEHSDEQVVEAALEIINQALDGREYGFWFLMENLWGPGFTFTRPEITRALLDGVRYPRTGIMLDTGHLMHTDMGIDTPEQGIAYIHRQLDAHGELCARIKGVHLHSGASGAFLRRLAADPPRPVGSYFERLCALYESVLRLDPHVPLECPGARELIERIAPEYLTYEFITSSREQHEQYLARQNAALGAV